MSRLFYLLFRRPLHLRAHLVILFIAAMTPLIVFAVYMIHRSGVQERETFRRGAIERVRAIMTAVDIELKNSITTLEALATSEALDRDDLRAFYDQAMRVFKSQRDWSTINISDIDGRRLIDVMRPFGAELPPIAEPAIVKQVFETRQTAIGNLVLGPVTGQLDFGIRVPVVREGRTKYALSGIVRPAVIGALLAKQQLPPGWVLAVVDANGGIVARTLAPDTSLGQDATSELRRALSGASEGWFRGWSLEGDDVYRAYIRSPFSRWAVSLNIPAGVVDAPLRGTPWLVALFGLGLMTLGVALAVVFSQRTAESIEALSALAEDFASGKDASAASGITEIDHVREALVAANRAREQRAKDRDAFERELWQQASLLELSHDAIFVFEFPRGPILYWNRGAEMLYSYSKAEAVGRSSHELLKTIYPRGLDAVEAALVARGEWSGDIVHFARDGGRIYVDSRHVLSEGAGGRRFVLETNRDITERKRAESRAQVQAAINAILAESPTLGDATPKIVSALGEFGQWDMCSLWLWDTEAEAYASVASWLPPSVDLGEFEAVTRGRRAKLALRKGLLGRVFESKVPAWIADVTKDPHFTRAAMARRQGVHGAFAFPITLAAEVIGFVECYSRETRAPDPDFVQTLVMIGGQLGHFVERKRAESENELLSGLLREKNEELERRVQARTAELTQANAELKLALAQRGELETQLRHAQKMEALGTLAGGIAHDFNNILGVVIGWARESINEKGASPALNAIISAGERGASIVKQLLAFARKQSAADTPVALNAVVNETLAMLKPLLPATIEFDLRLDPALPEIRGDAHQIQQALVNICLNARDATAEGGTIAIRTSSMVSAKLASGGDAVVVEISDTGAGMDEATKARIFEPFFTTKEATTGGTGLGLAVVYGILQAHDGAIEVESAPGRGSTFRLFFPLPSRPAAGVVPAHRAARAEGGGATLLIVDDEVHLLALLKWAAENRGFRVLTAGDGPEALAICDEHIDEIAAVVLDCGLPKMSGRAVFEKMKEMNPDIVVVAVTGYLEPGIKSAMMQSGVKHFIHKPCSPDEILEKVALYCRPAE